MKKRVPYGLLLAIIAVLVSACAHNEEYTVSGQPVEREFVASFATPTKTSVDDKGKVDWSQGDVISYYTASEGNIGKYSITQDCHTAKIKAGVGEYDSFIVAVHGATISDPLAKSMSLSGMFSKEQDGSFANTHVSLCKRYFDDGNVLNFTNISGYFHFSLKKKNVSYILFTAEDGTKICGDGTATVTFSGDQPTVVFGEHSSGNVIKINANRSGDFYIATLPVVLKGFSMRFYDDTDQFLGEARSDKQLDLSAGNMINLGEMDARIKAPEREDLSSIGTANCYIASKSGYPYKFKATVKGNSTESVGTPKTVKVLWESYGTDTAPKVGDVVSEVSLSDGYVNFTSGQNGNALIQVGDADGDVLWSWHIWVCDGFDPKASAQVYYNDAGIMMDRNLGATSVVPGDIQALGLMYEWGRKDPFMAPDGYKSGTAAKATNSFKSPVDASSLEDDSEFRVEYSIKNPTTFMYNTYGIYPDWSNNNKLWQQEKTKYDPCPVGWRVPESGVWSKAALNESSIWKTFACSYNSDKSYFSFECLGDSFIWYPACRYYFIHEDNGKLATSGNAPCGIVWTCTGDLPTYKNAPICFFFYSGTNGKYLSMEYGSMPKASGNFVRCVAE